MGKRKATQNKSCSRPGQDAGRLNPRSTRDSGLTSSRESPSKAVAKEIAVQEAMVRITYFKNGWIPVGVRSRGGIERKNSGGSLDKRNGNKDRELRRKDGGVLGHTVSTPTINPMRPQVQPHEVSATVSLKVVKLKSIDHEHKQQQHHNPKPKKSVRKVQVSVDNRPSRSARPVQISDNFYEKPKPAIAYHANVGALTVVIVTLFSLVFYGRLCAIFFTSVWCYLLPILAEQLEKMCGMTRNTEKDNNITVDLQSRKKVMMDGLVHRKNNL